ncbi:MAG: PilZ domain-containing protein [Parvibaculaceae bacterium]
MVSNPVKPNGQAAPSERRRARRYQTLTRAMIVVAEPAAQFECVIRNISIGGALLVVRDTGPIPDTFTLDSAYHPALPCRVAWRTEHRLGVQFGDTPISLIGG